MSDWQLIRLAPTYEIRLFVKELDIIWSRNALPDDFRRVNRMLEECHFRVKEAVTSVAPLEKTQNSCTG